MRVLLLTLLLGLSGAAGLATATHTGCTGGVGAGFGHNGAGVFVPFVNSNCLGGGAASVYACNALRLVGVPLPSQHISLYVPYPYLTFQGHVSVALLEGFECASTVVAR